MVAHSFKYISRCILPFLFTGMCLSSILHAQSDCVISFAKAIGSVTETEKGYCLAAGNTGDVLYVGGLRNDSVIILEVNLSGDLLQTWTFDFVPGKGDHLRGLIVDSEGMLVGLGGTEIPQTGSGVFAFRFDPVSATMIWSKEYQSEFQNFSTGIFELSSGDDYLMLNNPHMGSPNDLEILKLDRTSGAIDPTFSKQYHLGGSESLGDIVFHNGYIYSAGRFTDGPPNDKMRTTLVKLDPNTGDLLWTVLGHRPFNAVARLYGADMVIDRDTIFVVSLGNPSSASISVTQIYVQAFSLDGDLIWIKQYDLPGTNDWVDEIVSTTDGFIVMGRNRLPPSDIFIFKIDHSGELLWAQKYDFTTNDNSASIGGLQSQMLILGESIFFTAFAEENGNTDIMLVKFRADGERNDTCSSVTTVNIPVIPVANPQFYHVQPQVTPFTPQAFTLQTTAKTQSFPVQDLCTGPNQAETAVNATICEGESYEGYTVSGVYTDQFSTQEGCDSSRVLTLVVMPTLHTLVQATVCPGEQVDGYGTDGIYIDTLQDQHGCDSIRTLELDVAEPILHVVDTTICEGESYAGYNVSGVYTDQFSSQEGCDSARVLTLIVAPVQHTLVQATVCFGEQVDGYGTDGIYIDTLQDQHGCDSIRTLELNIMEPILNVMDTTICSGESFEGYSVSGAYTEAFTAANGCDSLHVINLTVLDPIQTLLDIRICEGEDFEGYVNMGMYMDVFTASNGCDSIRTLQLEVVQGDQSFVETTVCTGDNVEGYGQSGMYLDTFKNIYGCDSIRTLALLVIEPSLVYLKVSVCDPTAIHYPGPGVYVDTLTGASGCDSVLTLEIENNVIYVPNVFSPNNDGVNDFFEIHSHPNDEIIPVYFAIFDRWGNMAYQEQKRPVRWDGKDKSGQFYNPGVFTWIMKWECGQEIKSMAGDVTLIR